MTSIQMIGLVIAAAGLAILVNRFLRYYELHLADDAARMRVAADRLEQFRDVVEQVIDHGGTDHELKVFAASFARAVTDREFARVVAADLCNATRGSEPLNPISEAEAEEVRAFTERQLANRASVDLYRQLMTTGMVAAVLQWTDTSKQMAFLLSEIAIEPEQHLAAKAAVRTRRDHWDQTNGPLPMAA